MTGWCFTVVHAGYWLWQITRSPGVAYQTSMVIHTGLAHVVPCPSYIGGGPSQITVAIARHGWDAWITEVGSYV